MIGGGFLVYEVCGLVSSTASIKRSSGWTLKCGVVLGSASSLMRSACKIYMLSVLRVNRVARPLEYISPHQDPPPQSLQSTSSPDLPLLPSSIFTFIENQATVTRNHQSLVVKARNDRQANVRAFGRLNMAPLIESFPARHLESKVQTKPDGKRQKPPVDLEKCELKEMVQYFCELDGPKEDPNSKIVCEPCLRMFRR